MCTTMKLLVGLMLLHLFTVPPAENLCKQAVCLSQTNVVLQLHCPSRLLTSFMIPKVDRDWIHLYLVQSTLYSKIALGWGVK